MKTNAIDTVKGGNSNFVFYILWSILPIYMNYTANVNAVDCKIYSAFLVLFIHQDQTIY